MNRMYLCGPITGLDAKEARYGWRRQVTLALDRLAIECISPMRGYDHLARVKSLSGHGNPSHVLTTPRGIVARDRWDTTRCDVLFCNMLGARQVSIGSIYELAWADLCRIPIVLCIESEGNPNDHAFVTETTSFRCGTLEEGIELAKSIFRVTV